MKRLHSIAKQKRDALEFVRHGRHEIWRLGDVQLSMPRHADIHERTAKAILKQAEKSSRRNNG